MNHNLGTEKISKLLLQLSIPAILGMLSSAIFNIVDRIFVGMIDSTLLTAVGITMPIQIIQMAFVLLIGIGTSALVSIKLGQGKIKEAEGILWIALKYSILFLTGFAILFMLFIDEILAGLAISQEVLPHAKEYIIIVIIGSIIGIPGYCLNNSLRSIGKASTSMKIVIISSIVNIILDPIFIFVFDLGIGGAAIATVISQVVLTVYVIYAFMTRKDFMINLKIKKVEQERTLLFESLQMGLPSFLVQILAAVVSIFINNSLLEYGTDLDIASVTIMSTLFSFYNMVVVGIVQGNNAICGYNYGSKQYHRVRRSLLLAMIWSFALSFLVFLIIYVYPQLIVGLFTKEVELLQLTNKVIKYYLAMIPLVGLQTVASQYFQVVGKSRRSSMLAFLRYGVIIVPSILILAPRIGANGIYISNAISDGVASIIAICFIIFELKRLKKM